MSTEAVDAIARCLYARLGVDPDADLDALRRAYRALARRLHPDLQRAGSIDTQLEMALVNEAWEVLSNPERRADYDLERARAARLAAPSPGAAAATKAGNGSSSNPTGSGGPASFLRPEQQQAPRFIVTRKGAWLDGMAMRIRFLAGYAGRSAAQTMLLRHPGTARDTWEPIVPLVCQHLTVEVGERIRAARAAGAAPLDLANAAALIGLSAYADALVSPGGTALGADDRRRHAEMVDRMYETLAYELPRELVQQLGNSPKALRRLDRSRR